jgi:hypothetical protein
MSIQCNLKATLIIAAWLSMPIAHAASMSKADYKAEKERIGVVYKADKAACGSMAGNAKDICVEEAKAKEKVAHAELKYNYSGKSEDHSKFLEAKAKSAYKVAKEKCDDKAGNDKDVCVKEAKAAEAKALADAKMGKQIREAKKEATEDKRDADYKVAVEKCNATAGDAKTSCLATAKANFGKN